MSTLPPPLAAALPPPSSASYPPPRAKGDRVRCDDFVCLVHGAVVRLVEPHPVQLPVRPGGEILRPRADRHVLFCLDALLLRHVGPDGRVPGIDLWLVHGFDGEQHYVGCGCGWVQYAMYTGLESRFCLCLLFFFCVFCLFSVCFFVYFFCLLVCICLSLSVHVSVCYWCVRACVCMPSV